MGTIKCPKCMAEITADMIEAKICFACGEKLEGIADYKKEETNFYQEYKNKKREEQEEIQAKREEFRKKYNGIIVTTGEIHQDYDIIGPVYVQLSNKGGLGSSFDSLLSEYRGDIQIMQYLGTMSQNRSDFGFLYGEWSVGQNNFEKAFYIATEELKKRTYMMGGDAIVYMRQDIDIDTNGLSYFYLQMYGTAVRLKKE